jgi:hypothetical protein
LNSLPVMDKRLIRYKFWGNFGYILGFSNVVTFASFKGFGKWNSQRQWLNKCVRCNSGFLGRYLRFLFGIPSSQEAFLNLNEFANLCMSQCLTFPKCVLSTEWRRAWTLGSASRSWFSSHSTRCELIF